MGEDERDEQDDDCGFTAMGAPPRLMLALTGDPTQRATALAQLWAFGCLQDETEPIWGALLDELVAEVEGEGA